MAVPLTRQVGPACRAGPRARFNAANWLNARRARLGRKASGYIFSRRWRASRKRPRLVGESFVDAKLVLLPGDGIGPEVVAQAERVISVIADRFGHRFRTQPMPMGGNAIDS